LNKKINGKAALEAITNIPCRRLSIPDDHLNADLRFVAE
jgi:hypothetical protein